MPRGKKLTEEQLEIINRGLRETLLPDRIIAAEAGCSAHTVWAIRKAREDKTRAEIHQPVKYTGGGMW